MLIDTSFDFRKDTPGYPKKDPDACSPTLKRYHKLLWSKPLPDGRLFTLDDRVRGHYLHHRSELAEVSLASDTVIPSFTRWGFAAEHPELCTKEENEAFMAIGYTIGGMMVFPGNQVDRKWTINQGPRVPDQDLGPVRPHTRVHPTPLLGHARPQPLG
jgi:hypothetical protein